MKTWEKASIEKIEINATEYFAFTGDYVDGTYVSRDGKYNKNTYSGPDGEASNDNGEHTEITHN